MAQSSGFLLDVKYSEWLGLSPLQMATDSSGAIYILSAGWASCADCVTKLSADGTTVLWQDQLEFEAFAMAVDPNGGVYVIPGAGPTDTTTYVAKLNAAGSGVEWQTSVGFEAGSGPPAVLAADAQGRAYVAGEYNVTTQSARLVRLNAAGTAIDYTAELTGTTTSIAVDQSGAAYVAGYYAVPNTQVGFLERVAPDGTVGYLTTLSKDSSPAAVALDANGDAVVVGGGVLQRLNSTGAITLTTSVSGAHTLALDAAGNAYVTGGTDQLYPVKRSVAACGWISVGSGAAAAGWLSVIAPDGSLLQTTYIPGAVTSTIPGIDVPLVAIGANGTVLVSALAGTTFSPTQSGPPFAAGHTGFGADFLMSLSPNANAQTVSLACVGNAASYVADPVAPGEVVTLYGNGLGPQLGVQLQASLEEPYPTQAAGVEVTFDGTAAPLMWVQDAQINVVAPWSLTPGGNTQICVSYNNVKTNCLTWPVAQADPAVFTADGTYAAAVNQDGSLNSAEHPAPVGSIVSVWATGLGPLATPEPDGTLVAFPLLSNVLTAGVESEEIIPNKPPCGCGVFPIDTPFVVTYAGSAPYLVAGISQINFQVVPYPNQVLTPGIVGAIFVTLPSTRSPGFQIYVAGQ